MNQYLLTFLLNNEMEEKARQALVEELKNKMGKVVKEDAWGSRELSYPIQRQTKAYYMHFEFESDPATISALDKQLKVEEDVLRYLLVRA